MEQGENKLRRVYEDYLATLDEIDGRISRDAIERWDKFLEGRPPDEVDGKRREWFEMAQEESGLAASEVREVSARVARFYEWLSLARPMEPPFGGGVAKPAISRDAGLPSPPPSLASDPKLWVQGPSVGPPPSRPHVIASVASERPVSAPVSNIRAIWVVALMLGVCVLGILPYILVVTPLARLETDLSVYIRSADQKQMEGMFEWLLPRAHDAGIELDAKNAQIKYIASEAAQFGVDKLKYVDITVPGRQFLFGVSREVEINARALSEFRVGAFQTEEQVEVAENPAFRAAPSKKLLTPQDVKELRALRPQIDTAIENLRATIVNVPVQAQKLLGEELAGAKKALEERPGDTRADKLLRKVVDTLLKVSKEETIDLTRLDNTLVDLETLLRQVDRQLDLAASGDGGE